MSVFTQPEKKYCLFPNSARPYQYLCDPNLFYGFPKYWWKVLGAHSTSRPQQAVLGVFVFVYFAHSSVRDALRSKVKVTSKIVQKGLHNC